jgi:hypothetical protein
MKVNDAVRTTKDRIAGIRIMLRQKNNKIGMIDRIKINNCSFV